MSHRQSAIAFDSSCTASELGKRADHDGDDLGSEAKKARADDGSAVVNSEAAADADADAPAASGDAEMQKESAEPEPAPEPEPEPEEVIVVPDHWRARPCVRIYNLGGQVCDLPSYRINRAAYQQHGSTLR